MNKNLDMPPAKPIDLNNIPELKEIKVRDGVVLRPTEGDHADGLLRVIAKEPTIRDRVSVAAQMHTPEDVKEQVEAYKRSHDLIRYTLLKSDVPIGLVSFWRDIDNPFDAPDHPNDYGFGFFLDPDERGKGLITDAVQRVMDTAQDVLFVENFVAFCEDDNPDSIAALTRLGLDSTDVTFTEENNGWVERKYVKPINPPA